MSSNNLAVEFRSIIFKGIYSPYALPNYPIVEDYQRVTPIYVVSLSYPMITSGYRFGNVCPRGASSHCRARRIIETDKHFRSN